MNLHLTVQVPRSPDLNQALERFQRKLTPLLLVFQPELVQLQGRLLRHTSREGVCCRLNLHLPTGQLSSEASAAGPQVAFRIASEELLRQLHRHKQRLRETRPRFHTSSAAPRLVPRPEAEAARRADLAGYFGGHYEELLGFVRRQLGWRERLGELPRGWLEPAEVLNEVVVAALDAEPEALSQNRGRWLLLLSAAAIRRLAKSYGDRQHGAALHSLEQADTATHHTAAEGLGEEAEAGEPVRLQDRLPSPLANPEEDAAAVEAMQRLAAAMRPLPRQQRHDLVLALLEGFRPQELAHISGRSKKEVLASLAQAEDVLRQMPEVPELLRRRLPLSLTEASQPGPGGRNRGMLPQRA